MNITTPIYILSGAAAAGGLMIVVSGAWPSEGETVSPPTTTESFVDPVVPPETVLVPGPSGEDGAPGRPPTQAEIDAAIARAMASTVPPPPGPPGQDGTDGQDGSDGADGTDGSDGRDGLSIVGPAGPASQVPGPPGADGADSQVPGPPGATGATGPASQMPGPPGPEGPPGPFCPVGYHLETIELHQRAPVDQDLPVTVCVQDVP